VAPIPVLLAWTEPPTDPAVADLVEPALQVVSDPR
jgi:hypothetical protein